MQVEGEPSVGMPPPHGQSEENRMPPEANRWRKRTYNNTFYNKTVCVY